MIAFLLTQNEVGLFTVAAAFGLGFSGIIPAYVLALRELFPAVAGVVAHPDLLVVQRARHGAGGWLAGVLYDHFGYYTPAFAAGIGANILNLLVVGNLVARRTAARGLSPEAGAGLIIHTPTRMPAPIAAGPSAFQVWPPPAPTVAAQAIEEKASAKVAMRDEVCRRRNWLRARLHAEAELDPGRRGGRRQNAEAADQGRQQRRSNASTATIGANTRAMAPMTASILARRMRRAVIGAVATRSGASSPEMASQARPPASWPAAITITGISTT